jgi:hypothetical protein
MRRRYTFGQFQRLTTDPMSGVSIMIPWNITFLQVLPGHRLEVGFADGSHGAVDMSKDDFSGVFAELAD